jgi:hypothetical protein
MVVRGAGDWANELSRLDKLEMGGRVDDWDDRSGRETGTGLVGEDEAAALNLAMFALDSPHGGGFDPSRSAAMDLRGGRVVCMG